MAKNEEDVDDNIAEDPDSQVDDDEMSGAEAGFTKGAEEEDEEEESEDEDEFEDDEVR